MKDGSDTCGDRLCITDYCSYDLLDNLIFNKTDNSTSLTFSVSAAI